MKNDANTLKSVEHGKRRWRVVVLNGIAILGALGLFTLLGFVNKKRSDTPIHSLEIRLEDGTEKAFLDSATISAMVFRANENLIGTPSGEVDLNTIHSALAKHPSVRRAQAYTTVDGRCIVKVKQRQPIARILNSDGTGFYLDKEGFAMPLSHNFSAQVPVFTGRLNEKAPGLPIPVMAEDSIWAHKSRLDEIYELTLFIRGNDFFAAQVEHVIFNEKGEIELIPRVGNHKILIGDTRNLELKYRKLMTFYAQTLHTRDLNQYRRINLKFDNQVVCEKY